MSSTVRAKTLNHLFNHLLLCHLFSSFADTSKEMSKRWYSTLRETVKSPNVCPNMVVSVQKELEDEKLYFQV